MSDRPGTLTGMTLTTRMLTPETWDDFAALVEANNGVWGGCWCMGFHPESFSAGTPEGNREAKRRHVTAKAAAAGTMIPGLALVSAKHQPGMPVWRSPKKK